MCAGTNSTYSMTTNEIMHSSVINSPDKQPNNTEMTINVKDRWLCVVCVVELVMSVGVEKGCLCLFNCWATQQCSQISCRRRTEILHANGVCKLVRRCLKFSATTNCQWFIYCLKQSEIGRLSYKKTVQVFVEALVLSERMSCLLPDPQDASEPQTCCGHGQQRWLTNGRRKKRERKNERQQKREKWSWFPLILKKKQWCVKLKMPLNMHRPKLCPLWITAGHFRHKHIRTNFPHFVTPRQNYRLTAFCFSWNVVSCWHVAVVFLCQGHDWLISTQTVRWPLTPSAAASTMTIRPALHLTPDSLVSQRMIE